MRAGRRVITWTRFVSLLLVQFRIRVTKFDSDISTNVAMVLSKLNKKSPIDLANILSKEII